MLIYGNVEPAKGIGVFGIGEKEKKIIINYGSIQMVS